MPSSRFPSRFARRLICVAAFGGGLVAGLAGGERGARAAGPSAIDKGPYLQDLGPTSVVVRAESSTASPASVRVTEAGLDGGAASAASASAAPRDAASGGGAITVEDHDAAAFHSIRVSGLKPKTRYAFAYTTAGSTVRGSFTTAPPPDAEGDFTFLVYGDDRTDPVGHAAVVRAMSGAPSDFLINTGDLVEDGSNPADWQSFFDVEGALLRDRCVFACVGNHELIGGSGLPYLQYFGPTTDAKSESATGDSAHKPRMYGSFRWGDARFFLLNAMDQWDSGPERGWLEDELRRADDEKGLVWRVVVLHHGPWSAGPHGGNARLLRAGIPALFTKHHVDLILAGHDHLYERGFADGLRYVVSGGGGAPLYPIEQPLSSSRKLESTRHFLEGAVSPEAIRFVVRRDDGSLIEKCGFTKTTNGWDCDPRPPVSVVQPASTPVPVEAPRTTSRCGCEVVGGDRGAAAGGSWRAAAGSRALAALGALATAAAIARRRARARARL